MNKRRSNVLILFLCGLAIILTACTEENEIFDAAENTSQTFLTNISEENNSNSPSDTRFTFVNGSLPSDGDTAEYQHNTNSSAGVYGIETNVCFYVPFGASAEQRLEGDSGEWVKIKEGSTVGDFTVTEAKSFYGYDGSLEEKYGEKLISVFQQKISLKGKASFTAEASIDTNLNGTPSGKIECILDDESSKKLFSFAPSFKYFDLNDEYAGCKDFSDEKLTFYLSESVEGFQEVYKKLQEEENANIKFEADDFVLNYMCHTVLDGGGYHYGAVNNGTVVLIASENASQNSIISQFETPWGGTPDLSKAQVTGKNDTELALSELTEDNWNYVSADWVYLAEPKGISYNSIDSADIFDEAKKSFKDAPQSVNHQHKE